MYLPTGGVTIMLVHHANNTTTTPPPPPKKRNRFRDIPLSYGKHICNWQTYCMASRVCEKIGWYNRKIGIGGWNSSKLCPPLRQSMRLHKMQISCVSSAYNCGHAQPFVFLARIIAVMPSPAMYINLHRTSIWLLPQQYNYSGSVTLWYGFGSCSFLQWL